MLDFMTVAVRITAKGVVEIYPKLLIKKTTDLMIRGRDFFAIYDEDTGLWSRDEGVAIEKIDSLLDKFAEEHREAYSDKTIRVLHLRDAETGMIDAWHRYCQKQMRDTYHELDDRIVFSDMITTKEMYASKRVSYPLKECDISGYDTLLSTLYSPEERHKIEWCIGAVVNGDSTHLQKFCVFYGEGGTGKSTVIDIITKLFEGYYCVFDAKAIGSASNQFALESFRDNPLVAIQHDGDLSHIEDNTRLNSLVSHEYMTVNEKFKSTYVMKFRSFLFLASNRPVRITDGKSGLIRRLIDIQPTGNKLPYDEWFNAFSKIPFELGGIALRCKKIYEANPNYYDNYIPLSMLGASNDFYNFVLDQFHIFKRDDGVNLTSAWEMYKTYNDQAHVAYPLSMRAFKEELKNYFHEFYDRFSADDGTRVRSFYKGFRIEKFQIPEQNVVEENTDPIVIFGLKKQPSKLDAICKDYPAQYAKNINGQWIPSTSWESCSTTLGKLDTSRLHYLKVPVNHIVIDFDLKNDSGEKDLKLNIEAAMKWPRTYSEVSRSGKGLHLHYIYTGDPEKLSCIYDEKGIEIKVYKGNSSLRRQLTLCTDDDISTIDTGLPEKLGGAMVKTEVITNEKAIRTLINNNLEKKYHGSTKCSIDYINKILTDAYASGEPYDVSDMINDVFAFAANSTNNAKYCMDLVAKMPFKSESDSGGISDKNTDSDSDIVFFDCEVFPNLFLVNWKLAGNENPVHRLINPDANTILDLFKMKLVGFNNRKYDNHMLYARSIGYSEHDIYELSQRIVSGDTTAFFREAYNISYTDIYDFSAKKQSLKKWEIELGIHHQELGFPWDKPVPEDQWSKVAEYCDNDVIATEAVFNHIQGDWTARKILAELTGMSRNSTTNQLSTRFIFGDNKNPQNEFNYRDLSKPVPYTEYDTLVLLMDKTEFRIFDNFGQPTYETYIPGTKLPDGYSILPFFPDYQFRYGKSIYKGIEVGEGGCVISEPGMYWLLALLDIASMHPSSIEAEVLFGPRYTKRFSDIKNIRILIKHKDYETAKTLLDGALSKFLEDESTADDLAQALKIVINSVYGLTAASFTNAFRDPRNKDNIVAKRGALFMINLAEQVRKRGFTVAHIKTDSIKVPNATPEIIKFITDYGHEFGYTFEHEATYDRMTLVNDAVYIAKYADIEKCYSLYSKEYVDSSKDICKNNKKHPGEWTATGTQFAVPYVFKTLFSKEPIAFEDMCETKSVSSGSIFLDFNEGYPDVSYFETLRDLREKNPEKLTKTEARILSDNVNLSSDDLANEIAKGHNLYFVGRVGLFCPIIPGKGGGILLRVKDNKQYAVTGTKGYRWQEAESVRVNNKEADIDRSYYKALVDAAYDTISAYGDINLFLNDDDKYIGNPQRQIEDDMNPFNG